MKSPAARMEDVAIRPLRADDAAAWRRLWTGYLAFYDTVLDADMIDTAFARMLSGAPHEYRGLIAEAGGRPVGLAHYLVHRHGWRSAPVCYLQDLFADPDMRGRGVGRALIEAVYAAADAAGAPQVYWLTQQDNATARQLYDRIGQVTPFIKYQRFL